MRPRFVVVFAIVASLLVVTATPGMAATQLVVGSEHSTDTEFNNAKTLDNVEVDGTGDSAHVQLTEVNQFFDGAEDGDVAEYSTSGSSGTNYDFSTTTDAATGAYGMQHELEGYGPAATWTETRDVNLDVQDGKSATVSLTHKLASSTDGNPDTDAWADLLIDVTLADGSTERITYVLATVDGSADTDPANLTFATTTHNAQTYSTFSRSINDDLSANGYANATSVDSVSFLIHTPGTSGGTDQLTMRYDDLTIDNLKLGEGQTGTYVGQDHTLDDAEAAEVDLTLDNASATVTVTEQSSGTQLAQSTYSSSGTHTLSFGTTTSDAVEVTVAFEATGADPVTELDSEGTMFTGHAPELDNASASPSGGVTVTESPAELSINVSDAEFGSSHSESVDVTFYDARDDSAIGTDTVTSNGTATTSWDWTAAGGGTVEWYAVAEDSYGVSTTSSTFNFTAPSTLDVRKENAPDELVKNATVNITFYSGDTNDPEIHTRETTDGQVDMTGLPINETMVVVAESDGYYRRHILIDDLFTQSNIYLLNETEASVEVRFVNQDTTGQFPSETTTVFIQRALTLDNETEYRTIAADQFGVSGYTVQLDENERYLIKVRNEQGDVRVLGVFTASVSETVEVRPVALGVELNESADYVATADQQNVSGSDRVVFQFKDGANLTTDLNVAIYEQGNKSNEIYNDTIAGPLGEAQVSQPLTANQSNKTWVVDWSATRDSKAIGGSIIVGPSHRQPVDGMPDWLKHGAAILFTVLTAAAFSQLNAGAGAVTMSMVGGGFWWIGWFPPAAGGAVLIALLGGVVYKVVWGGGR